MPFIGNQPALSYTSFAKQDFTTSATTSYTLDNPVANANELALFINFVRQEPTTAYTATGTSLTLTSATSASDDMYCVFLGKAVQTVNPPSGSVGASQLVDGSIALGKLSATGTKDATTFLRGDNTFASAGGANTPAFLAYNSSSQNITASTYTKVSIDTEVYDTANAFDNSTNFRFTPQTAGKYFVYGAVYHNWTSNWGDQQRALIYKNGSLYAGWFNFQNGISSGQYGTTYIATTVSMNGSSDYLELFGWSNASGAQFNGNSYDTYFGAYKLIGV
jgi:hypothetical protein